jgi:hypothetical protein
MRAAVFVLCAIVAGPAVLWAEDEQSCTTEIIVRTCGDVPVEDRKVKITFQDGERQKTFTDSEGRIEIRSCVEDISAIKVSGADPLKTNRVTVQDTTDEGTLATITLNICYA